MHAWLEQCVKLSRYARYGHPVLIDEHVQPAPGLSEALDQQQGISQQRIDTLIRVGEDGKRQGK